MNFNHTRDIQGNGGSMSKVTAGHTFFSPGGVLPTSDPGPRSHSDWHSQHAAQIIYYNLQQLCDLLMAFIFYRDGRKIIT